MARRWVVFGVGAVVVFVFVLWAVHGSLTSTLLTISALVLVPGAALSAAGLVDAVRSRVRRGRAPDDAGNDVDDVSAERKLWIGMAVASAASLWVASFPGFGAGAVLIAATAAAWMLLALVWSFDVLCAMESRRRLAQRVVLPAVVFVLLAVVSVSGRADEVRFRLSEGALDHAANHAITSGDVSGHVAGYRVSQVWVDFDQQRGAVAFQTPGGLMSSLYFVRAPAAPETSLYACDHLHAHWYLCSDAED